MVVLRQQLNRTFAVDRQRSCRRESAQEQLLDLGVVLAGEDRHGRLAQPRVRSPQRLRSACW